MEWSLDPIQESLPLALQLQFFENLLTSCLGSQENFHQFMTSMMSASQGNSVTALVSPSTDCVKVDQSSTSEQMDSALSIEKLICKNGASRFAISLYLRWILRSLQKMNLPLPPMNKQQIYSASGLPGCNFSPTIIDPNIGAQVTSTVSTALKMLETELEQNKSPISLPCQTSFEINPTENGNLQIECAVPDNTWNNLGKNAWKSMTLFDLAAYYFYIENYSICRKFLQNFKSLAQPTTMDKFIDIEMLNGFIIAVGGDIEGKDDKCTKKSREEKASVITDEVAEILKKIEANQGIETSFKSNKDIPTYRKINTELAAVFKGGGSNFSMTKAIEKLVEANIGVRLKEGLPQNSDFFKTGYKILNSGGSLTKHKERKLFLQYLSGIKKLDYSKEPIDVTVDKPWNKIKHTKLKKRDLILSLLREMQRPEKIYKLLQDLSKMSAGSNTLYIKRLINRFTNIDGGHIVDLCARASSGATPQQQQHDSNYIFILLAKAHQLIELKAYDDAANFYSAVEKHVLNSCSDKRQANIIIPHIRMQILYTKMLQFADDKSNLQTGMDESKKIKSIQPSTSRPLPSELAKQIKDCIFLLAENAQENIFVIKIGSVYLLETAFVTLLNLGEFEFVLGSCASEGIGPNGKLFRFRNLVQISSLISSAILHLQSQQKQLQSGSRLNGNANAANAADFKKTCKGLTEILLPCVQSSITATKRGRGGNDLASNPNKPSKDTNSVKAWFVRFLNRLYHPEIMTLLASFFISVYNTSVEDSSHEIQLGSSGNDLGLPILPISVNTSAGINEDSVLSLITVVASKGSKKALTHNVPWFRIQAEINFAQSNYLAALRFYVQSLMLTTHYFQKPWTKDNIASIQTVVPLENVGQSASQFQQSSGFSQNSMGSANSSSILSSGGNGWDDRIFHKMIKCTSELGHHATTVVLCQFLGTDSADYPTAFRSLEDRGSNDCMDDMYPFLWDVTALEYTVSMHTKRGELSRKRKALEAISQLEINTNNNEEILREARATRRSAFLRYMAAAFL